MEYFQFITCSNYRLETSDDGNTITIIIHGERGETLHIACAAQDLMQISLALAQAGTTWLVQKANESEKPTGN